MQRTLCVDFRTCFWGKEARDWERFGELYGRGCEEASASNNLPAYEVQVVSMRRFALWRYEQQATRESRREERKEKVKQVKQKRGGKGGREDGQRTAFIIDQGGVQSLQLSESLVNTLALCQGMDLKKVVRADESSY